MLSDEDTALLNGYNMEDRQYYLDGLSRMLFGNRFTDSAQNGIVWVAGKFAGNKGKAVAKAAINFDKKFMNEE